MSGVVQENSLFQTDAGAARDKGVSYSVKLDIFEGPLDLLLHLIRKNEVDIYDIPIAIITKQYLEYLSFLKELNLDVAGDFLLMASTLLQIKSRMLLPDPEPDAGAIEEDPRAELVQRLLEYQRYKDAAVSLGEREILGREVFANRVPEDSIPLISMDDGPLELDLFELAEAFRQIMARVPMVNVHEVVNFDTISIADAINRILSTLQDVEMLKFEELFHVEDGVDLLIVNFLALLELCRLKLVKLMQNAPCGMIYIYQAVADDTDDGATCGDSPA